MGRGRLIQQKDSTRIKQCWMDYLLYQDRPETDKHLLGEVNRGTVVSRENDRPMRFTPIGTGGGRVLQGGEMGSNTLLQQQLCPQTLLSPQMPHKTQCQMCRYTPKPPRHQTVLHWELQIHPHIRPHVLISQMGTTKPDTTTQLCM